MSAWHTVLQDASYKGVGFDIESVDESNGKALAEHARAFVQGVDLEDMGTTGRQVQIRAVFWGKGYAGRLKKLLDALEEPGAGVLVHPVWGRMQNMIAASWSYRHEADNVDYAAVDITFREAAEAQEIFVFENSFLVEMEALIAEIDAYKEAAFGFIDTLLAVDAGVSDLWGSALGIWSAGAGVFGAVRRLFDFNEVGWPWSGSYSADTFRQSLGANLGTMADMVSDGLKNEAALSANIDTAQGGLAARQLFDEVSAKAAECAALGGDLLSGKGGVTQLQKITANQMRPIDAALRASVCLGLVAVAVDLVETRGGEMSAAELMHVNRQIRARIQAEIDLMRAIQADATAAGSLSADALYSSAHTAGEALRRLAARFNRLIVAEINQKPPLVVRIAQFDCTVHQLAHEFYGDLGRADELVKLNPHIKHPAFIARGELVNSYAK
ncbi:DNA circularization protein [Neisseria musculi]|uniref:DNA circulation family protein n=2 Tax=Neisseria musculi TaxID=1815583 RepID=A0A7H1MA77_9NEIS|nr:DNA circularization N-terminal domain-containing protein [Neisseria musculi]QNT58542.1 DNA circulation family protein [Neisseria musculi]